ncbi:glycosyltransferase family 2 protein [Deferrisoma camini]|uniref:glycosyltransferase family 2 protein n=1 Tax=Deferrisoma camini TaxID=1035120 RepID=UPI0004B57D85|nr:glycosyltransferase family 2 protein [Deferrisoma camini]
MPRARRPVPRLSATVICLNEAEKIRGCLESVRFCDEVVVVDSGSTDGTVEIARQLADVVIERDWPGYVAQQNFAKDQARGEWVLSIDADERVTPALAREIQQVLAREPAEDGFRITRHVHYLGRWIDHSGWYPEPRVRLFRRKKGRWEGVDPHYDVVVPGGVGRLGGEIVHYTYDDMADHVHTLNRFSSILAQEHHRRGRRFSWGSLLLRPPLEFLKKYVLKRGFLDGPQGFYVASLSAFYVFLKLAKLWELERVGPERPWHREGAGSGSRPPLRRDPGP